MYLTDTADFQNVVDIAYRPAPVCGGIIMQSTKLKDYLLQVLRMYGASIPGPPTAGRRPERDRTSVQWNQTSLQECE